MGADISIEAVAGKLNRVGYDSFLQGLRQAKSAGNRNLELAHWLLHNASPTYSSRNSGRRLVVRPRAWFI